MKISIGSLLTFSAFFASAASASGLNIGHGPNGELILSGMSCAKLIQQRNALCQWKKSVEPDFVIPAAASAGSCKYSRRGAASLSVLSCLPELPKAYAAKKLAHTGPNCWGTAMSFHGLEQKPRFVWDEEMEYWMQTPVCRKLGVGEAKRPGDVINVYYPEFASAPRSTQAVDPGAKFWQALFPGRYTPLKASAAGSYTGYHALLHTVTWISPELAFGKDSPLAEDQFYFHRMSEVYGRPGTGEVGGATPEEVACQENQSLSPYLREYQHPPQNIRDTSCGYFSVAYRCGSIPEYFGQQALNPDNQELWAHVQALQSQAASLFPLVVSSGAVTSPEQITQLLEASDSSVAKDLAALAVPGLEKTTEMLLTLDYFTASGIRKTLEQANQIAH